MHAANKIKTKVLGLIGADTYQYLAAKVTRKQKKMYLAPLKKNFKEGTYNFVLSMFPKTSDQSLAKEIATDMSEQPAAVGISSMENYFGGNPLKIVRKIKVPVKAINADFWPTNIPGNRRFIRSFDAKIIRGAGHFVAQERPDEFNKNLEEFINELNK
jgi:pimeloyl-ACP methyl ester carboxylesterase